MHIGLSLGLTGVSAQSLVTQAISAIRRNNGTLYMVPDDFGLTLGQEDSTGPWLNIWSTPFDTVTSTGPTGFTAGTAGAKTNVRIGVSCGRTLEVGRTYRISFVPTAMTNVSGLFISGATNVLSGTGGSINSPVLTVGQRYTSTLTITAGTPATHVMFVLNTTGAATFAISEFTFREVTSAGIFIDSTGTQPVSTVGDVLGLLTDRSYGASNLGPELFTGAYWTGNVTTATYVGNEATATFGGPLNSTFNNWLAIPGASAANRMSVIEFWATWVSGSDLQVGRDYTVGRTITAASNGGVRTRYTAQAFSTIGGSNGRAAFGSTSAGAVWKIEIISVREVLGNHATQPTTANKPTVSARYNLLTYSEQFDNASWTKVDTTVAANSATAPDSTSTADQITFGVNGGANVVRQNNNINAGSATVSVYVKAGTATTFRVGVFEQLVGGFYATVDLSGGTITGTTAGATSTITSVGNGWYRVALTRTFATTNANHQVDFRSDTGATAGQTVLLWGAQLITTNSLPSNAYQRVNTATDYDSNPALFRRYMLFDGSNDSLSTTITTGNEGWVCAGVTFGGAAGNNETVFGSGAHTGISKGAWLVRVGTIAENHLWFSTGNGSTRHTATKLDVALRNTPRVVEGGWNASTCFAAVDGVATSTARSGDMTPPAFTQASVGQVNTGSFLQGPMSALVYTPVLPSASDRALIRRWIGSLQGQTL